MALKIEPFKQCRNCPRFSLGGPKPGFYYLQENGYTVSVECKCHKEWAAKRDLIYKCIEAHVDTEDTWESYRGNLSLDSVEKMKLMAKKPEVTIDGLMFYMYGHNGTQKTSMAKVLGTEIIKAGYSVFMTDMKSILVNILDDYREKDESIISAKKRFINKIKTVDFLIIDESFDREKCNVTSSRFEISYLDNFIRNRFETTHKSIMFISNTSPKDIESQGFGISLHDLVNRNIRSTTLTFKDNYDKSYVDPAELWSNKYGQK